MLAKDGSVNPDQTAEEQSDLGLHCLPTHIRPKTLEFYGNFSHHSFQTYSPMSAGRFQLVRQTLLSFFQDMHIRVRIVTKMYIYHATT